MALGLKRFVKKPVQVTAVQLPPVTLAHTSPDEYTRRLLEIAQWCGGRVPYEEGTPPLEVETMHGVVKAEPGTWVVNGPEGDFWPVAPDVFANSYEEAQEGEW
jgi:hypothetical protein